MDTPKPKLPELNDEDRSPLVDVLLEMLAWSEKRIEELEEQILKLKGETLKPKIQPSEMDKGKGEESGTEEKKPKKGPKRSKTGQLKIDETITVEPKTIPEGSTFKGYRDVIIQDIVFKTHNTCYRLAQYQTKDGSYVTGELPQDLDGCHFGKNLIAYILYQYHHQHVTQPLLLQQLLDIGVEISSGRLSQFITENLETFHTEKDELLQAGLSVSQYIHADDTGARHDGETGYCTHIGNELFAWFSSTESKSRINFLNLLGQGTGSHYVINEGAVEYMTGQKLPKAVLAILEDKRVTITNPFDWEVWLDSHLINTARHRKVITEGALMGGLLASGIPVNLSVISDDAGQFNVFDHALCMDTC